MAGLNWTMGLLAVVLPTLTTLVGGAIETVDQVLCEERNKDRSRVSKALIP